MAQFISCFEVYSNQSNATLGLDPNRVVKTLVNDLPVGGNDVTDPLPHPIIRPSAYGPAELPVVNASQRHNIISHFFGVVTGTNGFAAVEAADSNFWAVEGAAVPTQNPGTSAFQRAFTGGMGRTAPLPELFWSGASAGALAAAVNQPTSVSGHAIWSYPEKNPYTNYSHFVEWHEEPPDAGNGGVGNPQRLHQLLNTIADGGGSFSLGQVNGQDIVVNDCGFAAVAPEGAVYIRPEDFESGTADGIPGNQGQNTPSNYRFHPSVFLRRTAYYRGISSPYNDVFAFNATGVTQPFDIIRIDENPFVSNWLLVIDGAPQLVQVNHPAGSDLRRPRDIWNEVWVPLLGGSQAVATAIELGQVVQSGGAVFPIPTQVITSRLRFLEYARCLPLVGTRITQSGGPG